MIKRILPVLCGLALAVSAGAQTAGNSTGLYTNTNPKAPNAAIPGTVVERGYQRSRIVTTNDGLPNLQSTGVTNSVNAVVTNHVFEIPYNSPVGFSLLLGSLNRAGIAGTTNYIFTLFFDVSHTGTNESDFTTAKFLRRFNYPTNGGIIRYQTNFTTAELAGARYLRWQSLSNDAGLIASGTTNDLALYPTNANFGAKVAAP